MDNHQFRAILLKLQDRLSDNDRKRLHFFFGNDVPRRIRDDPSLGGTLSLMESLFDQDKINEQDFSFLITAFDEIRCLDAVKLLREHMQRLRSNGLNKSMQSLASIMPSTVDQLLQDQDEDKCNIESHFISQQNSCGNNNKFIDSNNTNINPMTVVVTHQTRPPSSLSRKKRQVTALVILKCLLLFSLLLIIALGILTWFYAQKIHDIAVLQTDLMRKDKKILDQQVKNNETLQTMDLLNDQVKDLENEKDSALIRAGAKFGGIGGFPFDDSLTRNFTCSHYLRGMVTRHKMANLNWYQFLYSTAYDNENLLEAKLHGISEPTDSIRRFVFDKDEKIYRIQGKIDNVSLIVNGKLGSFALIRGIRFFTNKRPPNESLDHIEGELFTEQFDGYTVGYVTGRAGRFIDQLQFYWYRTIID